MEEHLKEIIKEGIKEGVQEALSEIDISNMPIANGKDPNELLTIEQVKKETGFGLGTVQKIFKDPDFPAQRYVTPFKATRKAVYDYINVKHDYLSER